jgi:hypothetical protein
MAMTRGRLIFTAAAAACLLATLVYGPSTAQTEQSPPAEPPPAGAPSPEPFGPPGGMSEELRETMNIYMVFRLTEELELSDEQALKIMPLIKGREKARWEYFQSQSELQRDLAALAEDEESSDAELENLLTAIRQAKRNFGEHEDQLNLEIAALLSSRQYAKFVIFQQRFHHDMRQRVKRLRGMENHDRRHGRSD